MNPEDWEEAKTSSLTKMNQISKIIRDYGYSNKTKSMITDEKVCDFLVKKIREAKEKLFRMIETMYELTEEKKLNKRLQKLKDELDIFSDEIKIRHCEWKDLGAEWLRKIIEHDAGLIAGLQKLNNDLEDISKEMIKFVKLRVDGKGEVMYDKKFWKDMENIINGIEEEIDSLVRTFKEREAICNIRAISLEKTFQKMQENIEEEV